MQISIALLLIPLNLLGQDSILEVVEKQYPIHPQNIIKSNPLRVLWGNIPLTSEYRLNYEVVTGAFTSQEIALSAYGKTPFLNAINMPANITSNLRASGIRFQYAYRFYPEAAGQSGSYSTRRLPPHGFYISPHFSYGTVRFYDRRQPRQNRDYIQGQHLDLNLFFGWQFIGYGNWVVEIYGGVGYKNNQWHEIFSNGVRRPTTMIDWDYYNGNYRIHLGFNIGFGWD